MTSPSQDQGRTVPPLPGENLQEESPSELEERPQSRREWHGPFRSVVLPLVVLGAIAASIWYLETDGTLPFTKGGSKSSIAADATFVSFDSQGIKLGAIGGAPPKLGEPAPGFTLPDLSGKPVALSDFRGKTVILNFWATWCVPCRREFPELVSVYEQNKDRGLVIVGLNLEEAPANVRKFANEFGAKFPIVIDNGSVVSQYRLLGLPTTWFIDRDGIARATHVGLLTDKILREKLAEAGFEMGTP